MHFKKIIQLIRQLFNYYAIIQLFNYSACGVREGSILGPLVFLLYINNLPDACPVLDPILYADDTNLLYSNNDIETLFSIVNMELEKISKWFKANKLSLNIKKTNYTLFYKNSTKDDLSLKLPDLKIVNSVLKSQTSIKFLRVMLDENISWKQHIKTVETKLCKYISLLGKAKHLLNNESLKSIHFSYIHSYSNYANIVWASTNPTKLKKYIIYKNKQHKQYLTKIDYVIHDHF